MSATEDWLAVPTVGLSFISIASCLCVCVMSLKEGYVECFWHNANMGTKHQISMEIIFYLSLCDGLWSIELFLNWLRQISWLNIGYWRESQCVILGIYSQFLGCLSPLWHVTLAYHLCYLLFGGGLNNLKKHKYFHYIIIIVMAFVATVLPLYPKNWFGIYQNPNLPNHIQDFECWLKSVDYQLIWTIISLFSLVVNYFTLIVAFYRWKQTSFFILSPVYYHICLQILRFVIVYSLLRLPAAIDRLIEISSGRSYWTLIILNHYCQALIGTANFIVFSYNRKDKSDQEKPLFIDGSLNDEDSDTTQLHKGLLDSSTLNLQKSFITPT